MSKGRRHKGEVRIKNGKLEFKIFRLDDEGNSSLFYTGEFINRKQRNIIMFQNVRNENFVQDHLGYGVKDTNEIKNISKSLVEEFALPITLDKESAQAICSYYGIDKKYASIFREVLDLFQFFKAIKLFLKIVESDASTFDRLLEFNPKFTDLYYTTIPYPGGPINKLDLTHIDLVIDYLRQQDLDHFVVGNAFVFLKEYSEEVKLENIKSTLSIVKFLNDLSRVDVRQNVDNTIGGHYHSTKDTRLLKQFTECWLNSEQEFGVQPDENPILFFKAYRRVRQALMKKEIDKYLDDGFNYRTSSELAKKAMKERLNFDKNLFKVFLVDRLF